MREEVSSLCKTDSGLTSGKLALLVIKILIIATQLGIVPAWVRIAFCLKRGQLWRVSTKVYTCHVRAASRISPLCEFWTWVRLSSKHPLSHPASHVSFLISGITALNSTKHNFCDFACVLPKGPLATWHSLWQLMQTTVRYQMELLLGVLEIFLWKGQNLLRLRCIGVLSECLCTSCMPGTNNARRECQIPVTGGTVTAMQVLGIS